MINSEEELSLTEMNTGQDSSCSSSAQKMEETDINDKARVPGPKRILSTEDPDYVHLPNAKHMKEMHRRAQDELSERVIKVVDKEFHYAMNEKQAELEEIDARILRLQQFLHTLRYCVSLNYYAYNKAEEVGKKQKQQMLHPAVRKHLGKAPVMQQMEPASHTGSTQQSLLSQNPSSCQNTAISCLSQEECKESPTTNVTVKREWEGGISSESEIVNHNPREGHDGVYKKSPSQLNESKIKENEEMENSRPPSPKYLPPNPPSNSQTICQGRHQRFQSKKRVVVGNTYQYLTPHADGEVGDALRYKWQVYVRAPTQDEDISSFISAVTFVLDQSYAPHHIITLKHPPFALSRRGWGEFKIQIVVRFANPRNKQVRLLHSLLLNRPDDPLALTGLWRLGQENWYDLWVYETDLEGTRNVDESSQVMEMQLKEDNCPATLIKELKNGVVSSQVEDNITVLHSVTQINPVESVRQTSVKEENTGEVLFSSDKNYANENVVNPTIRPVVGNEDHPSSLYHCKNESTNDVSLNKSKDEKSKISSETLPKSKLEGMRGITQGVTLQETQSDVKAGSVNGAQGKMCKIHVRQPDGRLVPYFIPAHMYSLALKIAQGSAKNQTSDGDSKQLNQQGIIDQQNVALKKSELQVSNSQTGNGREFISVKQEPNQLSTQQKEGTKLAVLELKGELMSENSKVCSAPVKILNFSPNKSAAEGSDRSLTLTASTSGIQSISRLPVIMQGKQTIARVSSGRLSPSPLQQLLVKTSLQDKKHTLVQQLLNKKGSKDGTVDPLQTPQIQVIDTQASTGLKSNVQFMPLKVVKEMQGTVSTSPRIIQKPISASNIRFITSNGQLLSAGKPAKEKTFPASSKVTNVNMRSCPDSPASNCIPKTSTSCVTPTNSINSDVVMMQGSPLVTRSSGLQLITSKGKATVAQFPQLMVCNSSRDTGTILQMPPFVVHCAGNDGAVQKTSKSMNFASTSKNVALKGVSLLRGSIVTAAMPTTVRSLLKSHSITTTADTTSATLAASNLLSRVTSSSPNAVNVSHDVSYLNKTKKTAVKQEKKSKEDIIEEDNGATQEWEEQVRQLEAVCRTCNSADICVHVWVRALPLVVSHHRCSVLLPFCARTCDEFLQWPLPKQRAAEFQRAREVKRRLEQCQVDGRERWSVCRIVAWARRHAHTPILPRKFLRTDIFSSTSVKPEKTLSHVGSLEQLVQEMDSQMMCGQSKPQEVDVVTVDEDVKKSQRHHLSKSPQKCKAEFIPWEEVEMLSGCEWVGQLASQLRLNLSHEEVVTNFTADAARASAWRAVLSLMEDLLRSSYSEAWEDTRQPSSCLSLVPPKDINLNHVLSALTNARPEFEIFTGYGLGTPLETSCLDN